MADKQVTLRSTIAGQEIYAKVAEYDSEGNLISASLAEKASAADVAGKANLVQNATSGNFAGLNSNGDLVDSGYNSSSLVPNRPARTGEVLMDNGSSQVWSEDMFDTYTIHIPEPPGPSVVIGGRSYKIVTMPDGNDWLAENLEYNFDGLTMDEGYSSSEIPKGWYYSNDETTYGSNGYNCGILYNWPAAKYLDDNKATLLPEGWHVPTNAEWNTLIDAIGGTTGAATKLKASPVSWAQDWGGADNYGFSVIPVGCYSNGSFWAFGTRSYIWTSSIDDSSEPTAFWKSFINTSGDMSKSSSEMTYYGCSIRLMKTAT